MEAGQDCLELDQLQTLDAISNESFNDSEDLVIESLESFISLMGQDVPPEQSSLESYAESLNPHFEEAKTFTFEDIGNESILSTAVDALKKMANAVIDFFVRCYKWVVGLFTKRNKTPQATADVIKEAKDLEKEIATAENNIVRAEKEIDDALHAKGKLAEGQEAKELAVQLVANYNDALTEAQIKKLGSRALVKDVIKARVDAYTKYRLSQLSSLMTWDKYQQFGLMASSMMDLLLKDYRVNAIQITRKFNDAVIEFRKSSSISDTVTTDIDEMKAQTDKVIKQMLSGYLEPFGSQVDFGKFGDGINKSSNTTIGKTLKHNVDALIGFLNSPDSETYEYTYEDVKRSVDSFLAVSGQLGRDHAKEVDSLLQAVEYSLKNLTEVLSTYYDDTRKRNKKINNFFSGALLQLQAMAQVAREITKVYNAYLQYTTKFVSTYVAIVGYHNRDIKTVLNYYMSITSGFKQRSLSQINEKVSVGEAALINAKNGLKSLVESNQEKANKHEGKYDTFAYTSDKAPLRKKHGSGLFKAQARRADELGYDIKSYPYDTRKDLKKKPITFKKPS